NVLKKSAPRDDAGDVDDVIAGVGAEQCGLPFEPSVADRQALPQACFIGRGHHLLQRRIGNQIVFQKTRVRGGRTTKLERRRRAVRLRIAKIGREGRGELVGQASYRVEMGECLVAVEVRAGAERIADADARYVQAPTGGCREALVDIERVERVEPVIDISRIGTDRPIAEPPDRMDDRAITWNGGIDRYGEVG